MQKQQIEFLDEYLPKGWLSEAVSHFRGKYSKQVISNHKNGKVQSPNLEILTYLAQVAQNNRELRRRLSRQLSKK